MADATPYNRPIIYMKENWRERENDLYQLKDGERRGTRLLVSTRQHIQ